MPPLVRLGNKLFHHIEVNTEIHVLILPFPKVLILLLSVEENTTLMSKLPGISRESGHSK